MIFTKKIIFCTITFALLFPVISCKFSHKKDINKTFEEIKIQTKADNKYIYFNIWNTKCVPCVGEMQDIDSLASLYRNKVDFFFLTEESDEKINKFLKTKNIRLKNCTFLNNKKTLIKFLCDRNHLSLSYPIHFIVNKKLETLHTHSGAITGDIFDPILVSALKKLK